MVRWPVGVDYELSVGFCLLYTIGGGSVLLASPQSVQGLGYWVVSATVGFVHVCVVFIN